MTEASASVPHSATPERQSSAQRQRFKERALDWLMHLQFVLYTILVLGLLAIGFLWHRMFKVIEPGCRGVMYRTVYGGTVTNRIWGEGLHVIPPWDKLYTYDLRLQQKTLDFQVLSDEGLALGVQVVVRYRPQEDMLGYLQKDIGPGYFESLIQPEIEAHIRRTFGGRPAHEVYASSRDVIQEVGQFPLIGRTEQSGAGAVSRPYVYVQELKLTAITLPKIVEDAIVEKYHQEQLMLAYRYKLEREEKEADRKRTEAAGIRDFNLIAGKVSPDMLRWRSIDAAADLAKSNNSKVIVLGSGGPGLAMQMNLGDTMAPPAPATASSEPAATPATAAAAAPPAAAATAKKEAGGGRRRDRDRGTAPPAAAAPAAAPAPAASTP